MTTTTRTRRGAATAAALATTIAVIAAGPTAAAHPGEFDSGTCAESLTRVWSWPGSLSEPDGQVRFSDAYESYVLRQPPCTSPEAPSPDRHDDDRVGHGDPL